MEGKKVLVIVLIGLVVMVALQQYQIAKLENRDVYVLKKIINQTQSLTRNIERVSELTERYEIHFDYMTAEHEEMQENISMLEDTMDLLTNKQNGK